MENIETLFDKAFKSRGGIYKPYNNFLKGSLLEDGRNLINAIRLADPRTPDVYINVINSPEINAIVTKYKGKDLIGIYAGAIYLIEGTFLRMMSNPNILPQFGDISKDIAPERIHNAQFISLEHYRDVVGFDKKDIPIPKDINRFRLGMLLSSFVTRFLVAHEYGHVLCGHTGYLDSLFESFSINEYFNSTQAGSKLQPLTSQALEMCADLYAFNVGINNILLALKEKEAGIKNGSEIFFNGLENSLKLWLFAIYSFLRLFGMCRFEIDLLKTYSHPPQAVRSFFYFKWLELQLITKKSALPSKKIENIIDEVIDSVEKAFAEISEQEYNLSFLSSAFKQEIIEHELLIMENWHNARSLTLPFAYIDLPPSIGRN